MEKSPSEGTLPRAVGASSLASLGAAWDVNSSAELPVRAGPADPATGEQMGTRMPGLSGLGAALGSGLWFTAADRDVALLAPGPSRIEKYPMALKGDFRVVLRVTQNCATSLDLFDWEFGGCCGARGVSPNLRGSALRFLEEYVSEAGFCRYGSRLSFERPHASLFSADFQLNASGPTRLLR